MRNRRPDGEEKIMHDIKECFSELISIIDKGSGPALKISI